MLTAKASIPDGYEIRELTDGEFKPLWDSEDDESAKAGRLRKNMGDLFYLNLGLFYDGEFIGWTAGQQESAETYYMRNSAVLPAHRRKGLYTQLLAETLRIVTAKGFQKIYSRHSATNNDVIIPKLKAGFTISSLEVTDLFGVLVHLVYFPKDLRRKMMIYRVGDAKPDEEIKKCLGLA